MSLGKHRKRLAGVGVFPEVEELAVVLAGTGLIPLLLGDLPEHIECPGIDCPPNSIARKIVVEGRVVKIKGQIINCEAKVRDESGQELASGTSKLIKLKPRQID